MQGTYNRTPGVKRLQKGYSLPATLVAGLKSFCDFAAKKLDHRVTQTEIVEIALQRYCEGPPFSVARGDVDDRSLVRVDKFFEMPVSMLAALERRRRSEAAPNGRRSSRSDVVTRAISRFLYPRPATSAAAQGGLSERELADIEHAMLPDVFGTPDENAARIRAIDKEIQLDLDSDYGHELLRERKHRVRWAEQAKSAAPSRRGRPARVRPPMEAKIFSISLDLERALRKHCAAQRRATRSDVSPSEIIGRALSRYFFFAPVRKNALPPDDLVSSPKPRSLAAIKRDKQHVTRTHYLPSGLMAAVRLRCAQERSHWGTTVTHNDILDRALKAYLHKPAQST